MNKAYKKRIDVTETLEAGLDEGGFFIMDDHMYRDLLGKQKTTFFTIYSNY